MPPLKWSTLAIAGCFALPTQASENTALQEIRQQIEQIKTTYEKRIAALEQQLLEKKNRAAEKETQKSSLESLSRTTNAGQNAAAFNPEISLILSGNYTNLSQNVSERRLQGFIPAQGENMPEAKSFNLGESELAISANIDTLFRGNFRVAVAPDNSIGVEEAHIQTLTLGQGFNLKAGRFRSGIGYQNEQHPHQWDFSDASLPYQAFFGHALGMDGIQLRWLAPTPFFLELGAESARAQNFPATDEHRNKNGGLSGAVFAHVGGDIGTSHSWRTGISYFQSRPDDRRFDDPLVSNLSNSFSGTSKTWGIDGLWKWSPQGNASRQQFKLQGEYFQRRENGSLTYDTANAVHGTQTGDYRSQQSGFYAQAVWQFRPQWRVGYRYDQLSSGSLNFALIDNGTLSSADLPLLAAYRPQRHTIMADWNPSEFSRLRLQYAQDKTRPEATDHQLWLQYVMSLGTHGAHKF